MYSDVTCVLLSGGKSTRMGENKALMKLGNKSVIERIVDIVKPLFDKIILVANTPEEYRFLRLPVYEDIYRYRGPLAGIHSGLKHSETEKIFVISCDIPLMSRKMIRYIVEFPTKKPVTICNAAGYIQPLAGVYSKKIYEDIDKYLNRFDKENSGSEESKNKVCRMHAFLDQLDIEMLNPESEPFYSDDLFFNMNRPEDYKSILKHF